MMQILLGLKYVLCTDGNRKQNQGAVEFSGKPYDDSTKENMIFIKDCEGPKDVRVPDLVI